jgi:hypothetical protein
LSQGPALTRLLLRGNDSGPGAITTQSFDYDPTA